MFEPLATEDLGPNLAVTHDVSDDSHFSASEFSASEPWLVRPVRESDCEVTDCGSHVQHALTRSEGKVEKDIVALDEGKGEITFVEESHDVERVAAILKNLHCNEIYQSSVCDKMRVEFGGRTIVAKDTLSMVKLAEGLRRRRQMSSVPAWCPAQ